MRARVAAGRPIHGERQNVRPLRVADEQHPLLAEVLRGNSGSSGRVAGEPLGRARAPEIAQRVEADDRNAVGARGLGDLLVEARPAAIAGHDDGEACRWPVCPAAAAPRPPASCRARPARRGALPARALRPTFEGGEKLRQPATRAVENRLGQRDERGARHAGDELRESREAAAGRRARLAAQPKGHELRRRADSAALSRRALDLQPAPLHKRLAQARRRTRTRPSSRPRRFRAGACAKLGVGEHRARTDSPPETAAGRSGR